MGGCHTALTLLPPPTQPWDGWLETGTYHGDGARCLAETTGVRGITCDLVLHGRPFTDPRIDFRLADSGRDMDTLLADCHGRLLVWLDAHFPDVYGLAHGTMRPLAAELAALWQWSQTPGNIAWIYADDARMLGVDAANGPMPTCHGTPEPIDLTAWLPSHTIWQCSADEGYLMLIPRAP